MNPLRSVGTAAQARDIDLRMRDRYGVDSPRLMDAAGTAVALRIREFHPEPIPVHVLAGPGHNGGDGWVVARVLSQCGYPTTVHCADDIHDWQKEAVLALGTSIRIESNLTDLSTGGVVIDALFGIGLNRPPDGLHAEWIRIANASDGPVWALDIPSGLDATDGIVMGNAIRATHTLAMGLYKSGYWAGDGPAHCGRIHLIPIGFAATELLGTAASVFFDSDRPRMELRAGSHKYQNGTVHVVGGSAGMSGAVVMAASAAGETGIGAVTAHVPAGLMSAVEAQLVQPVKAGYGSSGSLFFTAADVPQVLRRIASKPGPVVIGPGLGRHLETIAFVQNLLESLETPVVVDADALSALPGRLPAGTVLTPHPGELNRITGMEVDRWQSRHQAGLRLAEQTGAMVVSKGQPTAILTSEGETRIAGYDTRPFSRMGSGDVLAGQIGAYLTAGPNPDAVESALLFGLQTADSGRQTKP